MWSPHCNKASLNFILLLFYSYLLLQSFLLVKPWDIVVIGEEHDYVLVKYE